MLKKFLNKGNLAFKREQKGLKGLKPKINFLWKNRKYKNVKGIEQLEGIEIFAQTIKIIFLLLAKIFLPIMLLLIIILTIITIIWGWLHPTQIYTTVNDVNNFIYGQNDLFLNKLTTNGSVNGSIVSWAIDAVMGVLYLIFIKPLLWLLSALQVIVLFLTGGTLLNSLIMSDTNNYFHVPKFFLIFGGISLGLLSFFFMIKMAEVITAKANVKVHKLHSGIKNLFMAGIGILLIPIFFLTLNYIVNSLTAILLTSTDVPVNNIGLLVFNSSFMDGLNHFTSVPDSWTFADSGNFSYLICVLALGFLCYSLFLINILLVWRAFELLILYPVGTYAVACAVQDEGKRFHAWKEVTISRFINQTIILLSYLIFISSLSTLSALGTLIKDSWAQPIFVLIGVFGGATVVVKAPTMLAGILGNHNVALSEGLSNILGMKAVAGGIKSGMFAATVGRKSKQNLRFRRKGDNATWWNTRGGLLGAIRGTTSGLARYSGHVSGSDNKIAAMVGATAASKGVGSLATKMKENMKNHYDKGKNWNLNITDQEQTQRVDLIKNQLTDNILNSASKLKNIDSKNNTKNEKGSTKVNGKNNN